MEIETKNYQTLMAVGENGEEDKIEEKWLKFYSSFHQILLVGDGDFSFSLCLALSFGSASNIVASSLDSYDVVIKKYKNAKSNLEKLGELGAYLLHGVDATKMKLHSDLQMRKFDRIIYNFPHAGFHGKEDHPRLIRMHRNLVQGFFRNAGGMLRADGEIHVNHKTKAPFSHWNIEDLANQNSLALIECVDFKISDYPGYNNKRGDGDKCDEPFHLGQCRTFKFRFSPTAKKMSQSKKNLDSPYSNPYQLQMIQTPVPQQPPPFTYMNLGTPNSNLNHLQMIQTPMPEQPPVNTFTYMNCMAGSVWSPLARRNECYRIFYEYFNHAMFTNGNIDYDVRYSVHESLRLGFERYAAEQPGRPLNEFIQLLEELRHLSHLRSAFLQNMRKICCWNLDDHQQQSARR